MIRHHDASVVRSPQSASGACSIALVATASLAVGLVAVLAGASLTARAANGLAAWPIGLLVVAAASLVVGGMLLVRSVRLFQHGLSAIPEEIGPVASIVSGLTSAEPRRGEGGHDAEIESAAWVQVLLVSVAAAATMIAVTSFPSRFPYETLVTVAAMAWPAVVRIYGVRRRQERRRRLADMSRNRLAFEATRRYSQSAQLNRPGASWAGQRTR